MEVKFDQELSREELAVVPALGSQIFVRESSAFPGWSRNFRLSRPWRFKSKRKKGDLRLN